MGLDKRERGAVADRDLDPRRKAFRPLAAVHAHDLHRQRDVLAGRHFDFQPAGEEGGVEQQQRIVGIDWRRIGKQPDGDAGGDRQLESSGR